MIDPAAFTKATPASSSGKVMLAPGELIAVDSERSLRGRVDWRGVGASPDARLEMLLTLATSAAVTLYCFKASTTSLFRASGFDSIKARIRCALLSSFDMFFPFAMCAASWVDSSALLFLDSA